MAGTDEGSHVPSKSQRIAFVNKTTEKKQENYEIMTENMKKSEKRASANLSDFPVFSPWILFVEKMNLKNSKFLNFRLKL